MKWKRLAAIAVAFCSVMPASSKAVELQSNFFPSFALAGRLDFILSTHNTVMFGGEGFKAGAYGAFESLSINVVDTAYGAAVRFGEQRYVEIDGGLFQRRFTQPGTHLTGKGWSANVIYGAHLTPHFGLALFASVKRIQAGDMDRRWIYDLLPFFTLRTVF
jgi:hypothetical protein